MRRIAIACIAALAVTAAPAQAEPNPYSPEQVCGAGFGVVGTHVFGDPYFNLGQTYLLYNAGTGRNCAVTLKRYNVGNKSEVSVVLQKRGGPQKTDSGAFEYYAGPVYADAANTCVQWGGGARAGIHSAGWMSAWEHCA